MITFLPYKDFASIAKVLDVRRLKSQISEGRSLLAEQWPYHPACLMWKENKEALKLYLNAMLEEWNDRGYRSMGNPYILGTNEHILPKWFNNPLVYVSHQARLVSKKPEYYGPLFNLPDLPYPEGYYWPVCYGKKAMSDSFDWKCFWMKHETKLEVIDYAHAR